MRANYASLLTFTLFFRSSLCMTYISNSSLPSETLTIGCASALTAEISCDAFIRKFRPGAYFSTAGLTQACTTGCNTALKSYQVSVEAACKGEVYNRTDGEGSSTGETLPVTFLPDLLRYNFNRTCLKSNDRFCNNVAYQAAVLSDSSANPLGSEVTNVTAVDPCDDCLIKNRQFDASSPFYQGAALRPGYSSYTSSCSKTGFPLSTSTLPFSEVTTAPTPAPSCKGTTYTIKSGDTCTSISKGQGIGTSWLLTGNNLNAYCSEFPTTGNLCIDNKCDTYTVKTNDTCTSVAKAFNLTETQVRSWNPILDGGCTNLDKSLGHEICVGIPGQAYASPTTSFPPVTSAYTAAPIPTDVANGTNTKCGKYYKAVPGDYCNLIVLKYSITLEDFIFLNTAINANCTNLFAEDSYCVQAVGDITNYPGHPGYVEPTTTVAPIPYASQPVSTYTPPTLNLTGGLPLAKGTRKDCFWYVSGAELQIDIEGSFYETVCDAIVDGFSLSKDELENWNPSLASNGSTTSCAPDPSFRYCLSAYNDNNVPPKEEDPVEELPIREGAIATCTDYDVAVALTTCQMILDRNNITIAQFFAWNPAVQSGCQGLWLGYRYCVSTTIPGEPGETASSTPSPTSPTPPGPTQTGQPSNCVKWAIATEGSSCSSMIDEYLITSAQFYSWNPAVSSDCSSGFWLDNAYCVGISTTTTSSASTTITPPPTTTTPISAPGPTQDNSIPSNCNKFAKPADGSWCAKFAEDESISPANLYAWNAVLGPNGENCGSSFWGGTYYCTGVSS